MYFSCLDFGGFGGGGAGAFGGSGFNFFGGGGGGTGPTGGGGGGTNFQGGNSTNLQGQVFPSTTTLDSLLSSMGDTTTTHSSFPTSLGSNFTQPMQRPQHQTPPIFAATATNPGQHIYTTQQYLQPYLTPPIPHQQPLMYGRGRSNGPIVNGDGIIKSEPPDWTMDIIESELVCVYMYSVCTVYVHVCTCTCTCSTVYMYYKIGSHTPKSL